MNVIVVYGVRTGTSSYGVIRDAGCDGNVIGYAVVRTKHGFGDFRTIASHYCTSESWLLHDMGVTNKGFKRDVYDAYYPDGYVIEYAGVFKHGTDPLEIGKKLKEIFDHQEEVWQ